MKIGVATLWCVVGVAESYSDCTSEAPRFFSRDQRESLCANAESAAPARCARALGSNVRKRPSTCPTADLPASLPPHATDLVRRLGPLQLTTPPHLRRASPR